MKSVLAFCLSVLALPAAAAQYEIEPEKSELTFAYKQMGVPMTGRFRKFSGTVEFDPARPAAAKATFDVDVASIDTGIAEADAEVLGKDWFDARNHPRASFVATAVRALGGDRYEAAGRLALRGRTREIVAPFSFAPRAGGAAFEGSFTFRRADFGIGQGAWADFGTVANEVTLKFRMLAKAAK